VLGLLIGPSIALGAPFCMTNLSVPPQCMYYDAHQCQTQAARQGMYCVPNPNETRPGVGSGQYCLITAPGVSFCNYVDRDTCATEAARQHGVCYHDEARATGAPDPYSYYGGPLGSNPSPTP
jgi:hypothetical protein